MKNKLLKLFAHFYAIIFIYITFGVAIGEELIGNKVELVHDHESIDKELLELDKECLKNSPYMASAIADKWYERGNQELALEFDKECLKNAPYMASEIADKWYERGNQELALEFDKEYLKNSYMASKIADKWYERGDIELALEFDKEYLKNLPYMAFTIADKWYERGDIELALEFDKEHLKNSPYSASTIADKWYERGYPEIVKDLGKLFPVIAKTILNRVINHGNFVEAEEYGNKILEYWISQSDEDIRKNIYDKLLLAAKIESSYYYNILREKLIHVIDGDIIHNYSKYFENLPLNQIIQDCKDLSITDYLTHRAYINPEFLTKYTVSIEEARKMLEVDLYEIIKKSDIAFSILHVIALYAKKDPYYRLDIFHENPLGQPAEGAYFNNLGRLEACEKRGLRSQNIKETLVHEWTHQLMDILFNNNSKPYSMDNETAKNEWDKVMEVIWERLNAEKIPLSFAIDAYEQTIMVYNGVKAYHKNQYDQEVVARFSQMIMMDAYEDSRAKEFLKPIHDYWMKYILPAIEKYAKEHATIDNFVSDWERENILDPLYRLELDTSEYERDLSIAKKDECNVDHVGRSIGDKWYARGDIKLALEFDKECLKNAPPYSASTIADKWYARGDIELALEFDKECLKNSSYMASTIADKWYERGDIELALEFDKEHLKNSPYSASTIADKWYKRGDIELALEFDKEYLKNAPYMAPKIADKWYERGDIELALEFDKEYLKNSPYMAAMIADKWHKRGHEIK